MTAATSGCFCREINLLDGSFDNGVHFARESALAPIRALLRQEDRQALGALVVLYPSLSFANNEFTFANNLRLNRETRGSESNDREREIPVGQPFVRDLPERVQ